MTPDAQLPKTFAKENGTLTHTRLRGGKEHEMEKECPGSAHVQTGLSLGVAVHTDIFQLQLLDRSAGKPIERTAAYSLAVALRRALALHLGIEERELGCATSPSRSVFLFDTATGGAGYAPQAVDALPELLRKAREILTCPRGCDAACQACLLTYDTQHHLDDLKRKDALTLLDGAFFDALDLPDALKVFGPYTRIEAEPLTLALRREMQRSGMNELRLYLGGDAKGWEPSAWRLREELIRLAAAGLLIQVIVPDDVLKGLESSQRNELAALLELCGAQVYCPRTPVKTAGDASPYTILELGGQGHSVRWAATEVDSLVPCGDWGCKGQRVRVVQERSLPAISDGWRHIEPSVLRAHPGGLVELRLSNQCDGPIRGFGGRAWAEVLRVAPQLVVRLNGVLPLQRVRYNDRYLRSPLSLRLLKEFLGVLGQYPGGIAATTEVVIETSRLERNDTREPLQFQHDWRDAQDRRAMLDALFQPLGVCRIREEANRDLPHARELTLAWEDDTPWLIRLDQGLGYWRIAGIRRVTFPFHQAVSEQFKAMHAANPAIEGTSVMHPTYWYLGRMSARGDGAG